MGFWKTTGKAVGHVIDLRVDQWCDLPWLKKSASFFLHCSKSLLTLKQAKYSESFDEAVIRLGLTPDNLTKQSRRYFLLSLFFAFSTIGLLIYTTIIAYLGNWMGACVSFSLALYTSTLAVRCYFWHFQIIQQKLGCSIRECYQTLPFFKKANL